MKHTVVSLDFESQKKQKSLRLVSKTVLEITRYSLLLNASHFVLGDMLNFFLKHVCITRHAIPFSQRPGWNISSATIFRCKNDIIIALKEQENILDQGAIVGMANLY